MVNRDAVTGSRGRGVKLLHWIVEFDFALLHQLQHGHGGELLGYGAQSEFGSRRVGNIPLCLRHAEAFAVKHLAIFGHQHSAKKVS